MQTLNQAGIDLIKSFEGFSAIPYQDSAGIWTIGYGHTLGVDSTTPEIDEGKAEEYLVQDCANAMNDIENTITCPLSPNQFSALTSLVFNVGNAPLEKTLGILLNEEKYPEAAEQFGNWIYSKGEQLPGLIRRRAAEQQLFMTTS